MGTLTVNQNKLQKRLRRLAGEAIADFNMIEDGDKVMVCLSGGKDSYTMLDVLLHLQKVAPIKFEIVAVNMDQKQPGFPEHVLPAYLKELGVEYHIVEKDTYSVVKELIPRARPPARCARACAVARCTPSPTKSARPRWPWGTTATTSSRPSSSTCSSTARSRACRRSCAPTTGATW
jgi:predicted PP-loop superfamily ATPase